MRDDIHMGEEIKTIVLERLKHPLLGYISFSWLACNWSNIAFLFMSQAKVEDRITAILNQPNLWSNYFCLPVVIGTIFALFSPYLQSTFELVHSKAKRQSNLIKISLARSDFQASNATYVAKLEFDVYEANQKRLQKEEEAQIESLEERFKELTKSVEELSEQHDMFNSSNKELKKDFYVLSVKCLNAVRILDEVKDVTSFSELEGVQKNIADIFTEEQWNAAKDLLDAESSNNGKVRQNLRLTLMSDVGFLSEDNLVQRLLMARGIRSVEDAIKNRNENEGN